MQTVVGNKAIIVKLFKNFTDILVSNFERISLMCSFFLSMVELYRRFS